MLLADRLDSRDNNFDLLRLLAAWSVLVSHSFALLGRDEPLHQFGTTLGNVGVLVFFGVSGLLIRRSWEYDPSPRDFWVKRALRLLPALPTVGVVTAFVLGPLVTSQSRRELLLVLGDLDLPGAHHAAVPLRRGAARRLRRQLLPGAVNGPLWSLPVEVFAYFLLFLLGVSGLLARRRGRHGAGGARPGVGGRLGAEHVRRGGLDVRPRRVRRRRRGLLLAGPDRAHLAVALALLPLCVSHGPGPEPLRVVTWTLASVYLSYWFAYALPPIGGR